MRYMLDTNICIYLIKNKPESVLRRIADIPVEDICISVVTYSELIYGVEKSLNRDQNRIALSLLLAKIDILDFDSLAADEYGNIRAELERQGTPIGPLDTMIAAHARSENCSLVTNNTREFERVEGLSVENWL